MSRAIYFSNETLQQEQEQEQESQIIRAVVERHVGDAAFYWNQLDRSSRSPSLDINGLLHFERRMTAHLDGIVVAEESGWRLALEALKRWRGAGEMYVGAALVFNLPDRALQEQRWLELQAVLLHDPQRMLRGLIAALLRVQTKLANRWVLLFIAPQQPAALQVAAWRALARSQLLCNSLAQHDLDGLFQQALCNSDPYVRAAACRAANAAGFAPDAEKLVQDVDRSVSAEAALSLLQQGSPSPVGLSYLWKAIWAQVSDVERLTGAHKAVALHRLDRWVRYLGLLVPNGHEHVPRLLEVLPARIALSFLLHHADVKNMGWVQVQMSNPSCARFAAWTWASLLGVDLEGAGLALPAARSEASTHRATDDLDPGLPLPNIDLIQQLNLAEQPLRHGLAARLETTEGCKQMLLRAPQVLRWIAAQNLYFLERGKAGAVAVAFSTNADARLQISEMNEWASA